jgi:hypothetical protein
MHSRLDTRRQDRAAGKVCTWSASSIVFAMPDCGVLRPILVIACLKRLRSSARLMDGSFAPSSSTLYLSSVPFCSRASQHDSRLWATFA